MITIGGRPAAAVYADALREKVPYTITHTDESFRVHGVERGGSMRVYMVQDTPTIGAIFCRMSGQPFDEKELTTICRAVTHLPWSLQVTTAILEAATWLDRSKPKRSPMTGRPATDA